MKVNIRNSTIKIFIGIISGAIIGLLSADIAKFLKIFPDMFIKLIKMVVAPIIFFTVVLGILIGNTVAVFVIEKVNGSSRTVRLA